MNKQNQVKKKKCQIVILRRTPRKEKVGIQVLYILFQHSITCSANMEIKIKKIPEFFLASLPLPRYYMTTNKKSALN
jgi:hypothetical protein